MEETSLSSVLQPPRNQSQPKMNKLQITKHEIAITSCFRHAFCCYHVTRAVYAVSAWQSCHKRFNFYAGTLTHNFAILLVRCKQATAAIPLTSMMI